MIYVHPICDLFYEQQNMYRIGALIKKQSDPCQKTRGLTSVHIDQPLQIFPKANRVKQVVF